MTIRRNDPMTRLRPLYAATALCCALAVPKASAQALPPVDRQPPAVLDPVVVTATRSAERAFDLPVAIDSVDAAQIQQGQLQVNLSESLARVPGLAEYGVGRNTVKQALLRQLYGETGIEEMRAVKRALDPHWKLAPGVIFERSPVSRSAGL